MAVGDTVELFRPAGFRWWLSGGHALEAHLELELARPRRHRHRRLPLPTLTRLLEILDGWDIHVAAAGRSHTVGWSTSRPGPIPEQPLVPADARLAVDDRRHRRRRRRTRVDLPTRSHDPAVLGRRRAHHSDATPYLAPELQLLFKSKDVRPKDDLDAATVVPVLEPERRSWLANHLPAEHPWQTTIAGARARPGPIADATPTSSCYAAGRSSQAWRGHIRTDRAGGPCPDPELRAPDQLPVRGADHPTSADAGHPVCTLAARPGRRRRMLDRTAPCRHADRRRLDLAETLRRQRRGTAPRSPPTPGNRWGPLENRADLLRGTSPSANRRHRRTLVPRIRSGRSTDSDLDTPPARHLDPDLVPTIADSRRQIVAAATEPFGVLHSDLHRQHLLHVGGELDGMLDFGDAFIGSTAWDFALLHWYYGPRNAHRVAAAYGADGDLSDTRRTARRRRRLLQGRQDAQR